MRKFLFAVIIILALTALLLIVFLKFSKVEFHSGGGEKIDPGNAIVKTLMPEEYLSIIPSSGKSVTVVWATWCKPCHTEIRLLMQRAGITCTFISVDRENQLDAVKNFMTEINAPPSWIIGGQSTFDLTNRNPFGKLVKEMGGTMSLPYTVVYNDGKKTAEQQGFPEKEADAKQILDSLLK